MKHKSAIVGKAAAITAPGFLVFVQSQAKGRSPFILERLFAVVTAQTPVHHPFDDRAYFKLCRQPFR